MFRVRELMPGARTTEIKSERSLVFYLNSVQFIAGRCRYGGSGDSFLFVLLDHIAMGFPDVVYDGELFPGSGVRPLSKKIMAKK